MPTKRIEFSYQEVINALCSYARGKGLIKEGDKPLVGFQDDGIKNGKRVLKGIIILQ
jgi:hypothetical protein